MKRICKYELEISDNQVSEILDMTITTSYVQLKTKHQDEINNFPIIFAFDSKGLEEGMLKLGLAVADKNKLCSIGGGGYIKKEDLNNLNTLLRKQKYELKEAIKSDTTGGGFIFDAFNYELSNHEYIVTQDTSDALYALNISEKDLNDNPLLLKGLKKACINQNTNYL